MYQTNQQAWDEVTREYQDSLRRTEVVPKNVRTG